MERPRRRGKSLSYQYHLQEKYEDKDEEVDRGVKANYSSNAFCHSCDSIWMIFRRSDWRNHLYEMWDRYDGQAYDFGRWPKFY